MIDDRDLLLAHIPVECAGFQERLAGAGGEQIAHLVGAKDVRAFRNLTGDPGVILLARTRLDALDEGLAHEAQQLLASRAGETCSSARVGIFRFARHFDGETPGDDTKIVSVIGRAAGSNPLEEFRAWYDEDHMASLAKVAGVLRATRFEDVHDSSKSLAVYEFDREGVPAGAQWRQTGNTAWTRRVRARYVKWLDFHSEILPF